MNEELAIQRLDELKSMENVKKDNPAIPVEVYMSEAEALLKICPPDKDGLVRVGLDWNLVEDLPLRMAALKLSQANWIAEYKGYQDCQAQWNLSAPEGFKLRDELLHHFFFAFSDLPREYEKVRMIAEGSTNDDMIQDLAELSRLGKRNITSLQAIDMDLSLLDTAMNKSFELGSLLGDVTKAKGDGTPLLMLRNKAFNHLKEAMDKIRSTGQYIFWKDEDKSKNYASQYLRKPKNSGKKNEAETEVPVQMNNGKPDE